MLSIARFSTSIPATQRAHQCPLTSQCPVVLLNEHVCITGSNRVCLVEFSPGVTGVFLPTHGSGHWQVADVLDLKLLDLLPHRLQKLH